MKKTYAIKVFGRVQGVNFRRSAAEHARAYGIVGFVRNEPDGSIVMEAEGDEEALRMFLVWCRKGSYFANVERMDVEEIEGKEYKTFEIKKE